MATKQGEGKGLPCSKIIAAVNIRCSNSLDSTESLQACVPESQPVFGPMLCCNSFHLTLRPNLISLATSQNTLMSCGVAHLLLSSSQGQRGLAPGTGWLVLRSVGCLSISVPKHLQHRKHARWFKLKSSGLSMQCDCTIDSLTILFGF